MALSTLGSTDIKRNLLTYVDSFSKDAREIFEHFRGYAYANGQGVPQDDVEAVAWYRQAAEQGYADAQFNLGVMYADGEGRADTAQHRPPRQMLSRNEHGPAGHRPTFRRAGSP